MRNGGNNTTTTQNTPERKNKQRQRSFILFVNAGFNRAFIGAGFTTLFLLLFARRVRVFWRFIYEIAKNTDSTFIEAISELSAGVSLRRYARKYLGYNPPLAVQPQKTQDVGVDRIHDAHLYARYGGIFAGEIY